jgi:hypothetical protein
LAKLAALTADENRTGKQEEITEVKIGWQDCRELKKAGVLILQASLLH